MFRLRARPMSVLWRAMSLSPAAVLAATATLGTLAPAEGCAALIAGVEELTLASHTGAVHVIYEPPESAEFRELAEDIQAGEFLESIAQSVNDALVLPADLILVAAECGTVNAVYLPEDRTIVLCYELVAFIADMHLRDAEATAGRDGEIDSAGLISSVMGATEFVIYHEIGHALIDLLGLPITEEEEDAVDQLATFVLLGTGDDASVAAALDGVHTFLLRSAAQEATAAAGGEEPACSFRSEHALDAQRFQNVTCWVFGSDSALYSAMIEEGPLSAARAARCPAEWTQMAGTWGRLLAPHGQP